MSDNINPEQPSEQPDPSATSEEKTTARKPSHLKFWILVAAILICTLGVFEYGHYRIAREQQRQDLIADEFVYKVDQETGVRRLVPRHADWKERIEKINARYGK